MADSETTIPAVPPQPQLIEESKSQPELPPLLLAADLKKLSVKEAIAIWLPTRRGFIHEHTYRDYGFYGRRLAESSLGRMTLKDIKADHIRQYQTERRAAGCGPHGINHEGSMLQQILRRAGLWQALEYDYQPLKLPRSTVGRALDEEEQARLLRIAKSEPRWETAYVFALISLNTTAGPKEVLALRRKHVDLDKRVLFVGSDGAKNKHRIRPIPLNEISYNAFRYAIEVAERKGSTLPEHYIFPYRCIGQPGRKWDPTRYARTLKTAWDQIRIASGLPDLRLYDLRHTALTRLYEDPTISDETIEQIAGHRGPAMKKRYAHVRMEAKRSALARLVPERNERLIERLNDQTKQANKGQFQPATPLRIGSRLSNKDIQELFAAGLSAKVIIAKIDRCQTGGFDTSPTALKLLQSAGIPDSVILAMVQAE
jgi:integrase